MRIQKLNSDTKKNLLEYLLKRSPNNYGQYEASVKEILDKVKEEKDAAVFAYTAKFDGAELTADTIEVTDAEIEEAYAQVDDTLLTVIRKAKDNIESYHAKQRQNSWFDSKPDGTILGQKITPLHRVGVYVPGGKAVYPSSVLMNVMPAKVAGVDEIIMVTPPGKNGKVSPNTLVAAKEAGVDKIYKVGGAQAIAALAYGTESIPKVDKIVGPGNIYVALARKQFTVMSALIPLQDQVKSWLWQMRQLIRDMLRQTCFPRQSMMSSLPQFLLRQVKSWHMRYPIR